MDGFFRVGKLLTLGFWILPTAGLLGLLGDPWNHYLVLAGAFVLLAHIGELALTYGKLKALGRARPMDLLLVLLVGLFHWMPLLKKPT